ncbi:MULTISPECIES: hypothetical protein [Alphaproteobacteria]|uniref:hypothetical protein n=1 Tax=Alphaproteobacteria TaxID=28211 RepID=UPI00326419CE
MSKHLDVFEAIERATGVNPNTVRDERMRLYFFNGAAMVFSPPVWSRPKEIEEELEGIRADIRALKKRIHNVDRFAIGMARREATKQDLEQFTKEVIEAKDNQVMVDSLVEGYFAKMRAVTPDKYVDHAAIRHLEEMEKCLVRPIEVAIEASPKGRGRPKNNRAYEIASFAAKAYLHLTGEKPTFWNGTDNAFTILVEELFNLGSVLADIRKPIEAAMSKLEQGEGI